MNYLLDTHIFLWTVFSSKKVPKNIRKILTDTQLLKYVSLLTFWEISLKFSLGKIKLQGISPEDMPEIAVKAGYEILNLEPQTVSTYHKLPKGKNKDPFDRMLAWQAICKDYKLITQDSDFKTYKDHGLKIVEK